MSPEEFVKTVLDGKKLKLEYLHEEHRIAIAVYNAKRDMLISDINVLEQQQYK